MTSFRTFYSFTASRNHFSLARQFCPAASHSTWCYSRNWFPCSVSWRSQDGGRGRARWRSSRAARPATRDMRVRMSAGWARDKFINCLSEWNANTKILYNLHLVKLSRPGHNDHCNLRLESYFQMFTSLWPKTDSNAIMELPNKLWRLTFTQQTMRANEPFGVCGVSMSYWAMQMHRQARPSLISDSSLN